MQTLSKTSALTFCEAFLGTVEAHAERPAVQESGTKLYTYKQLYNQASAIATQLKALGVGQEAVVGICIDKSADYIAAMLGVWFAEAAFLPLDSKLPPDRLSFMVEEAGTKIVIAPPEFQRLFVGLPVQFLTPPDSWSTVSTSTGGSKRQPLDSLAYIIFTSGSTGKPKGVQVTHTGIVNFITAQIDAFKLTSNSRSLFYLSTSFDASVSDIGTALLSGACLCIEPPCALQPGPQYPELVRSRQITHMDIPPSMLRMLDCEAMPQCLETIIIGGEACPPQIVRAWAKRFRIVNVYGPTESTVCTSLCQCDSETWERPLIGAPLPGVTYQVLGENLETVPHGTPGELYIGGIALARGYLNRPDLTERKFIIHNGERLYKTGDLVVSDSLGDIQFLGRTDRQFKLRGLLIEPEEIESRLAAHPQVLRAAVLKRLLAADSAREALVAFVSAEPGNRPDSLTLRNHLVGTLPRWMLPQHFEIVNALPHTVTGKVDFAQLRSFKLNRITTQDASFEALGKTGALIAQTWCQVLSLDRIGADDDFFDLGGDSFAVIEASAAAEASGLSIAPAMIMAHSTVRKLTKALEGMKNAGPCSTTASGGMRTADLRADIKLDKSWKQLLIASAGRSGKAVSVPTSILLTGASGFLGSRLLLELLERTTATVHCVVRAKNEAAGLLRIEQALSRQEKQLTDAQRERLRTVCGSLEKPNFGLALAEWKELADNIDTIYHCAALVNMVSPYEKLRPSNVDGVLEVAKLAATGRRKWLHYASTLSVFVATDQNTGVALESDILDQTQVVFGGYAQTKWAAEVLLRQMEPALGPVSHYRFGLITGDTVTGKSAPNDFLALFGRGLAALGCVPASTSDIAVDVTPIDYSAAAMAHLSLTCMKNDGPTTYHIANERSLTLNDLCRNIRASGVILDELAPTAFLSHVREGGAANLGAAEAATCLALCRNLAQDNSFDSLRTMDLFQATGIQFDQRNTLRDLHGSGIACPAPSDELVQIYLKDILGG